MIESTNITPETQFKEKSTVEALHSDVLRGTLELKIRMVLYRRACLPDTERERALDRILAGVRDVCAELGALSPQVRCRRPREL